MSITPLDIKSACTEETLSIGDDVMVTVLKAQDNLACMSIVVPGEMEVAITPPRKIFQANDGTRMAAFRIGDTLLVGLEISLMLLTAKDGKVRLGVNSPEGSLIRRFINKNYPESRSHAHGFF